jgi:hypothetical protein
MKTHVEQLCPRKSYYGSRQKDRRWHKREASKLMRRLGRSLGDDAPRRLPVRGYTD